MSNIFAKFDKQGGRNLNKFVNIANEWKKRHKCLVMMLNIKVNNWTRNEASKSKVIIKRVSDISTNLENLST